MEGAVAKPHSPADDLHAGPPATPLHGVQLRGLQLARNMPRAPLEQELLLQLFPQYDCSVVKG